MGACGRRCGRRSACFLFESRTVLVWISGASHQTLSLHRQRREMEPENWVDVSGMLWLTSQQEVLVYEIVAHLHFFGMQEHPRKHQKRALWNTFELFTKRATSPDFLLPYVSMHQQGPAVRKGLGADPKLRPTGTALRADSKPGLLVRLWHLLLCCFLKGHQDRREHWRGTQCTSLH